MPKFVEVLVMYFLPTLVSLFTSKRTGVSTQKIFWLNLLLGWTVVMWLVAFWLAVIGKVLPGGGTLQLPSQQGSQQPAQPQPWQSPFGATDTAQQPVPCSTCGGSGKMTCPQCSGTRGRWDMPTTQHGQAQWVQCGRCAGSGTVQCTHH